MHARRTVAFGWIAVFGLLFAGTHVPVAAADAQASTSGRAETCSSVTPSRIGGSRGIGGIQWARPRTGDTPGCAAASASPATPPSPGIIGSPPVTFHGGAVTGTTTTPGELTVTPVFWVPTGFSVPATYRTLVNQYIADIAADSGKRSNVFSSVTEFTKSGGAHLSYKLHTGTPINDTTAFPANGCTPDTGPLYNDNSGYTRCITNAQLLSEANAFTTAHGLPKNDLAHLYMYFLPKHVETCFTSVNGLGGGTCSVNPSSGVSGGFCGYHAFASPPLVANMNYAVVDSPTGFTCSSDAGSNTGGNQSPNANIEADSEISITSHEIIETITDPQGNAWYDSAGYENGDECAYIFGDSTSFIGAAGAKHNQVVNGHFYFIQEEPSIHALTVDAQWACEQRNQALVSSTTPANNAINVFPNKAVVATFDVAMNHAPTQSAFTLKRTSTGALVAGTFSWFGNALIFKPNADLVGAAQYTANVSTAARSALGDPLPAAKTWRFTVTNRPVVETVTPANNATGISRSVNVTVKFSKPMNHAATQAAFTLKRTSTGTAVAGVFSWSGNTLTFNPNTTLVASTKYTAAVSAAAKDTANNALLNPTTWSFTTGTT
jgi:hypothetical protein